MCDFCKDIADNDGKYTQMRIKGGDFITKEKDGYGLLIDTGDSGCLGYIGINYCPMCGRNLATDNEVDDETN